MSIWYPGSGLTYQQYLQANSFVRDVTGRITTSGKGIEKSNLAIESRISEQTKQIIASHQELSHAFGEGFNKVNSTLEWGFNRISGALEEIDYSIQSLHSDFNYSMGLLIEEMYQQNRLLLRLVDKLDAINKTLESPTLTQAREFYKIGCDRLAKGLLDKALEAFSEAEKKNDVDFFTQFQIGKLYLYGIDEDDDVLDLENAKKHLLLAARYAKAEIGTDPSFARLAAEALLHASISLFAKLGDDQVRNNEDLSNSILEEARRLTSNALSLCPELSEASYHLAKYSSTLNDETTALSRLEEAILSDRHYAVKVDIDHAFDPMRPRVLKLLTRLKESMRIEATSRIEAAEGAINELLTWYPNDRSTVTSHRSYQLMQNAKDSFSNETYFGFLDAATSSDQAILSANELKEERGKNLNTELQGLITAASKLPEGSKYSHTVKSLIQTVTDQLNDARKFLSATSYSRFDEGLASGRRAKEAAERAWDEARIEDEAKARAGRRYKASSEYAKTGAGIGAVLGFVIGIVGCINVIGSAESMDVCGLPFIGAIIGVAIGFIIGHVAGQTVQ